MNFHNFSSQVDIQISIEAILMDWILLDDTASQFSSGSWCHLSLTSQSVSCHDAVSESDEIESYNPYDEFIKPMSAKQYRKYDPGFKYRHLHGHTGTKSKPYMGVELSTSGISVSEATPVSKTCLDKSISNIEKKIESIHDDAISHQARLHIYTISHQYQVPVVGHIVKEKVSKTTDNKVYIVKRTGRNSSGNHWAKVKLVGRFCPSIPLECLNELQGTLSAPKGCGSRSIKRAFCHSIGGGYFTATKSNQFLQIDFGVVSLVTHLSFRARAVASLRWFPNYKWLKNKTSIKVTGDSENQLLDLKKWNGPRFWFVDPDENFSDLLAYEQVEVFYRVNKGFGWVSLGIFKGPNNNFEERVHLLDTSIHCRYLKFKPVRCDSQDQGIQIGCFGNADKNQLEELRKTMTFNCSTLRDESRGINRFIRRGRTFYWRMTEERKQSHGIYKQIQEEQSEVY